MSEESTNTAPAAGVPGPRQKRWPHKRARIGQASSKLLAAIDLGTNNCRLLIATIDGRQRVRVVDSFARIVRLGEGVAETGLLSQAAIDRTIDALKICAGRIK